ncbi:MAG: hypothetical protein ACYDHU_03620 [Acidimicrobiales bacterium]
MAEASGRSPMRTCVVATPVARERSDGVGSPPKAGSVLWQLRGDPSRRPRTDPSLAGGLREWLEDGVGAAVRELPPEAPPVRIDRWTVSGRPPFDPRTRVTAPRARRALLGVLFRQLVVTGRIDDPIADAVEALAADEQGGCVLDGLDHLPAPDRAAVRRAVAAGARTMTTHWSSVPPAWRPRTRDRIRIPLAGGRVVLATTVDLLLGTPPTTHRSVCAVHLSAEAGTDYDRHNRRFTGLLDTLRSGAPPFRVATYHPTTGELVVDDLTDDDLAATVRQTIDAVAARRSPEQERARAA